LRIFGWDSDPAKEETMKKVMKGYKAMRCVNCAGQFITRRGYLNITNKILGNFIIENTEWDECEGCGEKLYSPITLNAIEKTERERKNQLLLGMPLKNFILATEVGNILGCTRQAIHKHRRIRRGFIHFVKHNGKLHYLRESVELYKATGDGRLPLVRKDDAFMLKNIIRPVVIKQKKTRDSVEPTTEDICPDCNPKLSDEKKEPQFARAS
jgi:hypothetical protein